MHKVVCFFGVAAGTLDDGEGLFSPQLDSPFPFILPLFRGCFLNHLPALKVSFYLTQ